MPAFNDKLDRNANQAGAQSTNIDQPSLVLAQTHETGSQMSKVADKHAPPMAEPGMMGKMKEGVMNAAKAVHDTILPNTDADEAHNGRQDIDESRRHAADQINPDKKF